MRTLSSLLRRKVVTESGRSLGRCHDLRGELTGDEAAASPASASGASGWLAHLGVRATTAAVIPWEAVVRIEGKRIVVRDDVRHFNLVRGRTESMCEYLRFYVAACPP